jgi:hypothetical protein
MHLGGDQVEMEQRGQQSLLERLERLEDRHIRLERSYRIMKLATGVAVAACIAVSSLPLAESASTLSAVRAKSFNVVNAANRTIATLGPTADGNALTFFDSAGKKVVTVGISATQTAAGVFTWDNNNVEAGTGIVRAAFGEGTSTTASGFGAQVFDGTGHLRAGFGLSRDLMTADFFAIDSNGSATGVGTFDATNFAGVFATDLNGVSRQDDGISLDGMTSAASFLDPNGVLRVHVVQEPSTIIDSQGRGGNGVAVSDPNGLQTSGMFDFESGTTQLRGFNVVDANNIDRMSAYLVGTTGGAGGTMTITTRDGSGNTTGTLP